MNSSKPVYIASNNAEIGGGEMMLLAIAEGLGSGGFDVTILGPERPDGVLDAAAKRGLATVTVPGADRVSYMRSLREWRKNNRGGLLWCNGLVPATATAGTRNRVVHLHQLPTLLQRPAVLAARLGSLATVVPSDFVAARVRGSLPLPNWTGSIERVPTKRGRGPVRLGFLGRPSEAKGIHVLADAFDFLRREAPDQFRLRVAGEPRFVDARERAFLEGRMRTLGCSLDRLGWMPADEFFGTIDILVVPSIVPESFGLVAAEAMSARVPVVVTDAGALPEVVGVDHPWIARAGDSTDLVRAIRECVAALPAEDAVDAAHRRWSASYSPEAGVGRLRALVDRLDLSSKAAT